MLPFHKRLASSEYTLDTDDLEPVSLPPVSTPPSFRPARPNIRIAARDDDERTMMVPSSRRTPAPQMAPSARSQALRMPKIPMSFVPRISVSDEEVTLVRPGMRSTGTLLTMRADAQPASHSPRVEIAAMVRDELASKLEPRETAAGTSEIKLDAAVPSAAQSQEIRSVRALDVASDPPAATITTRTRLGGARPTASWAAALVALGVFAGLVTAMVARGETPLASAAQAQMVAEVKAPVANVAAAQQGSGALPPVIAAALKAPAQQQAAPSCAAPELAPVAVATANPVPTVVAAAAVVAPAPEVKQAAPDLKPAYAAVDVKPASKPVAYVAPVAKPVVHAAAPKVDSAPAIAAAPTPAPKPAALAKSKPSKATGDDMEQASAADALARAQLEAALSR